MDDVNAPNAPRNDVNAPNAPRNDFENGHVVENPFFPPSTIEPLPTTIQGSSSMKKISSIRGWTKEHMLATIDDIKFRGYSLRASVKKHEIVASNI